MFLHRPGDKQVEIRLKAKNQYTRSARSPAGEFANALLDQVVRFHVAERTGRLQYTMARIFTTPAQSSIDQLLAELDAEVEDDLEIEVPWQNTRIARWLTQSNFLSLYSRHLRDRQCVRPF